MLAIFDLLSDDYFSVDNYRVAPACQGTQAGLKSC
jgi:hypothetical protein